MSLELAVHKSQTPAASTTSKLGVVHTSGGRVQPCALQVSAYRRHSKHDYAGDPSLREYEGTGLYTQTLCVRGHMAHPGALTQERCLHSGGLTSSP